MPLWFCSALHLVRLPLDRRCFGVFRVDLEEVVEDNENHGRASEEDGEGVKGIVRYHGV